MELLQWAAFAWKLPTGLAESALQPYGSSYPILLPLFSFHRCHTPKSHSHTQLQLRREFLFFLENPTVTTCTSYRHLEFVTSKSHTPHQLPHTHTHTCLSNHLHILPASQICHIQIPHPACYHTHTSLKCLLLLTFRALISWSPTLQLSVCCGCLSSLIPHIPSLPCHGGLRRTGTPLSPHHSYYDYASADPRSFSPGCLLTLRQVPAQNPPTVFSLSKLIQDRLPLWSFKVLSNMAPNHPFMKPIFFTLNHYRTCPMPSGLFAFAPVIL